MISGTWILASYLHVAVPLKFGPFRAELTEFQIIMFLNLYALRHEVAYFDCSAEVLPFV